MNDNLKDQLLSGPPTCGNSLDHEWSECELEAVGEDCYALMGMYEDDARTIYPAREKWWRDRAKEAADYIAHLEALCT